MREVTVPFPAFYLLMAFISFIPSTRKEDLALGALSFPVSSRGNPRFGFPGNTCLGNGRGIDRVLVIYLGWINHGPALFTVLLIASVHRQADPLQDGLMDSESRLGRKVF